MNTSTQSQSRFRFSIRPAETMACNIKCGKKTGQVSYLPGVSLPAFDFFLGPVGLAFGSGIECRRLKRALRPAALLFFFRPWICTLLSLTQMVAPLTSHCSGVAPALAAARWSSCSMCWGRDPELPKVAAQAVPEKVPRLERSIASNLNKTVRDLSQSNEQARYLGR